ncbi:protein O-linked-mannose beta-1,2-N-acetylglucosaminyltransferase 1 isoform X1 [Hydra vulgaris]|uniref:Alpha-1,3-mannosyl-glycoprotein 2-beta-N-acetylglucosaminyltransferase n=2 Tax=Hydra vulgaris TaxID=6087 RepID=A0ABM4C2J5_HYDVU
MTFIRSTLINVPCSNCLIRHKNRGCSGKLIQGVLIGVLVVTVIFNVLFIIDNRKRFRSSFANSNENIDESINLEETNNKEGVLPSSSKNMQIKIEAKSGKDSVYVAVDGIKVYENAIEGDSSRGMHIVVLNEVTGVIMASRVFDTYVPKEDEAMILFLNLLQEGRIVVFMIKDEGSSSLKGSSRNTIKQFGSRFISKINWRDSWAFISQKKNHWLAEGHEPSPSIDQWGPPIVVQAIFELSEKDKECDWGNDDTVERRKLFCNKYEGYGTVCSCSSPAPINLKGTLLSNSHMEQVPIAVIAANRPHYLFRMLRGLLTTPGVDPKMVTVYIDGFFDEPSAVAELFQVSVVEHTPICSKNCRISQHYKRTLTETFDKYPDADFMLILEEDLDVSKDIIDYFSQLAPLLRSDDSLYCISAWNDQGYEHSCKDPSLLYRVETMPGLGWLLKRSLFKNELEEKWPGSDKFWDWDMWMRLESNRKGRECIIPDVSRTYHFGAKGLNMNSYFQELYFSKHALNTQTGISFDVDKLRKDNYEEEMHKLIKMAEVVDHLKNPCTHHDFIPDTKDHTYVIYIKQNNPGDYETWNNLAKCFKLWDLDVRGFHKAMWRFFLKENSIFVVGMKSPYAVYKPNDVVPIFIPKEVKT